MIISLIAAVSENNVIGRNKGMPWHMPEDLKYFFRITKGHHVIMGRKTFQEFGVSKPLPERINIVISKDRNLLLEGVLVMHSLREALEFAQASNESEAFVIGGGHIYHQSMNLADRLYITKILASFDDGDTFFPEIDPLVWKMTGADHRKKDNLNPYDYSFLLYERKRNP